jgi:hypothetical protein
MLLARRPTPHEIERFLHASRDLPLSYGPIGIVTSHTVGRRLDEATIAVGRGIADFERARAALVAWKQFDIGWVETFPRHAPVTAGHRRRGLDSALRLLVAQWLPRPL